MRSVSQWAGSSPSGCAESIDFLFALSEGKLIYILVLCTYTMKRIEGNMFCGWRGLVNVDLEKESAENKNKYYLSEEGELTETPKIVLKKQ